MKRETLAVWMLDERLGRNDPSLKRRAAAFLDGQGTPAVFRAKQYPSMIRLVAFRPSRLPNSA